MVSRRFNVTLLFEKWMNLYTSSRVAVKWYFFQWCYNSLARKLRHEARSTISSSRTLNTNNSLVNWSWTLACYCSFNQQLLRWAKLSTFLKIIRKLFSIKQGRSDYWFRYSLFLTKLSLLTRKSIHNDLLTNN